MIKSALKVYRQNIWSVFATTGIVALGVLVALIVAVPNIYYLLYSNVFKIISAATSITKSGFDVTAFIESITRQLNGVNWRDPINTIQSLLNVDAIVHLLKQALIDSGFQQDVLQQIMATVNQSADEIVAVVKDELVFMITCVGISCLLAFISSRIVIQHMSTKDKSAKRFVIVFFLNLLTVLIGYAAIIVPLFLAYIPIGVFAGIIVGVLLLVLFLSFLWPTIFYREEGVEFKEIFNGQTILWYLLASLIILVISIAIVGIAFLISDVIALVLALPLIFVTNIIMENVAISYTTNYTEIQQLKQSKPEKIHTKKQK